GEYSRLATTHRLQRTNPLRNRAFHDHSLSALLPVHVESVYRCVALAPSCCWACRRSTALCHDTAPQNSPAAFSTPVMIEHCVLRPLAARCLSESQGQP